VETGEEEKKEGEPLKKKKFVISDEEVADIQKYVP